MVLKCPPPDRNLVESRDSVLSPTRAALWLYRRALGACDFVRLAAHLGFRTAIRRIRYVSYLRSSSSIVCKNRCACLLREAVRECRLLHGISRYMLYTPSSSCTQGYVRVTSMHTNFQIRVTMSKWSSGRLIVKNGTLACIGGPGAAHTETITRTWTTWQQ